MLTLRTYHQESNALSPGGTQVLDVDASIFQGLIETGTACVQKGRVLPFWQQVGLAFRQESIGDFEQRFPGSLKTGRDLPLAFSAAWQ